MTSAADDFDSESQRQELEYMLTHEEGEQRQNAGRVWAQSSDWHGTGEAEKTNHERNVDNKMDTMY